MRPTALAPLRDTLLVALGLGSCTPRPAGAPPADAGQPPVAAPQAIPAQSIPTTRGYVQEEDGTVHRASAATCVADNPRPACVDPGDRNAGGCTADAACRDGANPRCIQDSGQIGRFCQCDYSCATDSDCKTGQLCVCGEALGGGHHSMCVTAQCQQDSDCPSGTCGVSVYHNGCSETRTLACRTQADTCTQNADCSEGQVCAHDANTSTWSCQGITCAIGRPLLIDGAARTATCVTRPDWHDIHPHLDCRDIDPTSARALAVHWQDIAALEHASVASFARFTLELLTLAAPPDLVADAQRAALDEVEHARLAYALASRFAGRPLGPGPLRTADLLLNRPLAAFVTALVHEGCIGETLGAAEAELLAEHADPTLAPQLRQIAADETRHAALAWRTLQWLLTHHGDPVRHAARAALETSATELSAAPEGHPTTALTAPIAPAWGLLPHATFMAHRRLTLDTVVRPLLTTLLGPTDPDLRS